VSDFKIGKHPNSLANLAKGRTELQGSNNDRFWSKVIKTDGCWIFQGANISSGYGGFYMKRVAPEKSKSTSAHRVSWELTFGPIPDGLWVLHKCDNRRCVRPDHLFLGDRLANILDCAAKGRICTIGKSRLTHCKNGHEFTEENTYIRAATGHRDCRICRKARKDAWERQRALLSRVQPSSRAGG